MLKDVRDLRATKWVSRRATDAPKTIDEIHEEAKQEEIKMQLAHQQAAQKRALSKGIMPYTAVHHIFHLNSCQLP